MKKSVFRKLLEIAKSVVQQVQNALTAQLNVVQDEVQSKIESYVQEVVSDMWAGRGANAFVQAVEEDVKPKLSIILQNISQTHTNISSAVQIMDEADERVSSLVSNLRDSIDRI